MESILCGTDIMPITVQRASIAFPSAAAKLSDNLNVAAIDCEHGEFHLTRESFFGCSSLDGVVVGFKPLTWDFHNIIWAPKCITAPFIGLIVPWLERLFFLRIRERLPRGL